MSEIIDVTDFQRERRISEARLKLLAARTPEERRKRWAALRTEILARTPVQIARMERERGLVRQDI